MEDVKYNRLKAVLAEKGRTSKWLYEKLNVSKITVSRWVRNDRQPNIETLYDIAELLEIEVESLLISTQEVLDKRKEVVRQKDNLSVPTREALDTKGRLKK